MAEAVTRVRAFDQPGHVGDDERALAGQADDAEVGAERGEGIVGDLRPRRRDARNHRRLPGVGEADQPDVGEQLQMEPEILFLAGQARFGAARRAIGGRGELRVAAAADAALGDQEPLSRGRQIGDLHHAVVLLLVDDGADRHLELDVGALAAGAIRAFAVSAAVGGEFLLEAEIEKGIEVGVRRQVDRTAGAAVAAIGAAARHELLAPEAHGAAAAVPGGDVDIDFVDEHNLPGDFVPRNPLTPSLAGPTAPLRSGGRAFGPLRRGDPGRCPRASGWLLDRVNADDAAARAVIFELHASVDLRKQRVVLAEADVQARPETAAALPHEDRPAGHDVAVEPLDAEPLRIAVAAIARRALSLFMCHDALSRTAV